MTSFEYILVGMVVAVAGTYLLWRSWRAWRQLYAKAGCGGCGCSTKPDEATQPKLIKPESLQLKSSRPLPKPDA
jgi:hypothetical protein